MRSYMAGPTSVIFPKRISQKRVFDIGQVDVLRKRNKGTSHCDENMQDEDEYIMKYIIKKVGCIPTFWEKLARGMEPKRMSRICKTNYSYQIIDHQLDYILKRLEKNDSIYKQPCTDMIVSITTKDVKNSYGQTRIWLHFDYHQHLYRKIVNTRAYSSETLLGQVGGFVGMY